LCDHRSPRLCGNLDSCRNNLSQSNHYKPTFTGRFFCARIRAMLPVFFWSQCLSWVTLLVLGNIVCPG
jgi:hypothetical protein